MKPPLPAHASRSRRGFTLLEVVVAMVILGLVSLTLYQFVDTTLRAATFAEKSGEEDDALAGLRRLLAAQLAAMPSNGDGTLVGTSVGSKEGHRDAIQMLCPAGNALLTPDAPGFYQVTLELEKQPRGQGSYALNMEREPWTDDEEDNDDDDKKPALVRPSDGIKLMDGVRALEIGYFDARLNGWVEKWTDPRALPNLVRLRLTTDSRPEPHEIVLRVPGGGLTRVDSLPGAPNLTNGTATRPSGNGVPAPPPNYVPPAPPSFVPQPPPGGVPQAPPNLQIPQTH